MRPSISRSCLVLPLCCVLSLACSRNDGNQSSTYFSRKIGPVLEQSCASSPTRSSCHVIADDDERANALGNLSVESYAHLAQRRDLLLNYGPYGIPGLLLKVVPSYKLSLTSWNSNEPLVITTNIAHAGNQLVDFASPSFTTLQRWMANGAAENNAPQAETALPESECSNEVGNDQAFNGSVDPTTPDFGQFQANVNPILGQRCAAGNCHGSPANSLHLTCGTTPEQVRWNYFAAGDYISADAASSEILRRTLAPSAGGTYHEGGALFPSLEDGGYKALLEWAKAKGGPSNVPSDAGFSFFAERVQPMLVKRGCMMLGCHSAAMFHDYRLRGGSGGHFGLPATRKNYELSLEQLALESPNPNTSRIVRKNLPPSAGGILHRGGPLFAGFQSEADCDMNAAETGPLDTQAPYCVVLAWIKKERAARMASAVGLSHVVYVKRRARPLPDAPQDWESFAPGADVVRVAASQGANGAITLGASASLSQLCGLDPASSEARRPAVSWDGLRIAFAARSGASAPYRIYIVEGSTCAVDAAIDAAPVDADGGVLPSNGALFHDFDPTFAPDGRIVFVSTRGNLLTSTPGLPTGPSRTPADPSKFNTNLYVRENDGRIRQLTFLLNQETQPSFMKDGRVIYTTEKRAPGFYQLALRRVNMDGGDYHPLFGQRSTVGFNQVTEVVELADKNFAMIMSQKGAAHGAGTLAVVNRSIGVDQRSTNEADYLVDKTAISFPNEAFYQHSIHIADQRATGDLAATQGAYLSPSPLPDGRLLVSYAAAATSLNAFEGDFDVVVMDPQTGDRTPLITGSDDALWPVAVYARQNIGVFRSRLDEANAATRIDPSRGDRAEVTYLDLPLLTSLLFQNTRGRRVFPETNPPPVEVWQNLPPEPNVTSFAEGGSYVASDEFGQVYVRRGLLGTVKLLADGSAKIALPGGTPYLLATEVKLEGDLSPTMHFQREENVAYPGEVARTSFKRTFFNGMCGGCHGSLTGREDNIAVKPDILTQASQVQARKAPAQELGAPQVTKGPPFP
ncbi:MAG: TolB family protein [Myxococcota bacterium]